MAEADDLSDAITDAALTPAETEGDAGRVKARTIDEMIKADQYAKSQAALSGTSTEGGPVSAWGGALRPARAMPRWREKRVNE